MPECPVCGAAQSQELIRSVMPCFQNKTYASPREAQSALEGQFHLRGCCCCGFAWNEAFEPEKMQYDQTYQNEQSGSPMFREHLAEVLRLLAPYMERDSRIVEIGCGKGTFLLFLRETGYADVRGFDPAYEGDASYIERTYYSSDSLTTNPEIVILRHVLEHIPRPVDFLHQLVHGNGGEGLLYIEVPDFSWILERNAFWDLSYEHCNYFSESTFRCLFPECQVHRSFNGQYLSVLANCRSWREAPSAPAPKRISIPSMEASISACRRCVEELGPVSLWGAGAKGANFARIMDPDRRLVTRLIDINAKKQNRYVAGSGHAIHAPDDLAQSGSKGNLLVLNENYADEVANAVAGNDWRLYVLTDRIRPYAPLERNSYE